MVPALQNTHEEMLGADVGVVVRIGYRGGVHENAPAHGREDHCRRNLCGGGLSFGGEDFDRNAKLRLVGDPKEEVYRVDF